MYFFLWAEYFLIFFITFELIKNNREIKFVLTLLIISALITVISSIYQQHTGAALRSTGVVTNSGETYYRLISIFGFYSNDYGAYLILILSILVNILLSGSKKVKIGSLLLIAPIFYTLLYTFSRGSFLGLIALVINLFFIRKKHRKQILLILAIGILISVIIFAPVLLRWSQNTFALKAGQIVLHNNIKERLAQWETSLIEFTKNPILGNGFHTYHYRAVNYHSTFGYIKYITHAHNVYIRLLIESGILGFLSFILFIMIMYKHMFYYLRHTNSEDLKLVIYITFCSLSCFLVSSLTESLFTVGRVTGPLFVLFALMFRKTKLEHPKPI
jgi:O-antigen ligase